MKISGNTVLITGGTSGIGRAFAEQFLLGGSKVIICGRREDRLERIRKELPGVATTVCDVANPAQRTSLFSEVTTRFPGVNMLINNAGVQLEADMTREVSLDRIHTEIETNLVAPIHLSSLFVPHLAAQRNAAIINVSSGLAFVPIAFMPVYCASKAAIHSITLSLRHQLKNKPIQVFEIIPPSVDTELGHDRRKDKSATHGGMPVNEFIEGAMDALRKDILEAPVGHAAGLRAKREEAFEQLNSR